ncbi:MAG: helix-turn-helix domain-containing protein [Mesorhizobium sp.]|nr:MAG: helix-turn-helix domain-containing protein [Mesorhizobium sp.]
MDRAAFRDCDLLNTRHAAAFLGVKPKTLQNWRTGRNGPRYVRVGGTVSYSVGDLRAFVDCGLRTSTSDRGDLS